MLPGGDEVPTSNLVESMSLRVFDETEDLESSENFLLAEDCRTDGSALCLCCGDGVKKAAERAQYEPLPPAGLSHRGG